MVQSTPALSPAAAAAAAAAAAVAPDLQRLKLQFPQYKTNSLLYVLRRHKFDAAAAQRTLLTSSNSRFWRCRSDGAIEPTICVSDYRSS
jgi:hypothetical protein